LPWTDRQFDVVVCRLALHQVADPGRVVNEMVRVARPSGRVAIIDMVADDSPVTAAEMNRIERLRDPSHGEALTDTTIRSFVEDAGAVVTSRAHRDLPLDLEDWMARTNTPSRVRDEIRARIDEDLGGGPPTGLYPYREPSGAISFIHRWALLIATTSG
jgi:SAM-dependent methyltransferase